MGKTSPLLGTWALVSWYNETSDGRRIYPLGAEATGYISYTLDGFVFVTMMSAGRAPYGVSDPFGGSMAEDSAAMKSQLTYAGRFEERRDHVVHTVTNATCPNWVGTEQVRQFRVLGEKLYLSAAGIMFQNEEVTAYFDWQRATS